MIRCTRCGGPARMYASVRDPKTGSKRKVCQICVLELADAPEPDEDDEETDYAEWEPGE